MTVVRFLAGAGMFFLCHIIQTGSGIHSTSNLVGNGGFIPVKGPECEADHSPPSSVKVNNA